MRPFRVSHASAAAKRAPRSPCDGCVLPVITATPMSVCLHVCMSVLAWVRARNQSQFPLIFRNGKKRGEAALFLPSGLRTTIARARARRPSDRRLRYLYDACVRPSYYALLLWILYRVALNLFLWLFFALAEIWIKLVLKFFGIGSLRAEGKWLCPVNEDCWRGLLARAENRESRYRLAGITRILFTSIMMIRSWGFISGWLGILRNYVQLGSLLHFHDLFQGSGQCIIYNCNSFQHVRKSQFSRHFLGHWGILAIGIFIRFT